MKVRAYVRVAKHRTGRKGYMVVAGSTPNQEPLTKGQGMYKESLPTVAFAIDFEIPDSAFNLAERVIAEIEIPEDQLQVAAEVKQLA